MKELKKQKITIEDYVKHVNNVIHEDYEMFIKQTVDLKPIEIAGKKLKLLRKETFINTPLIRHKTCGNEFWMHRDIVLKKAKKGLDLCPCCYKHKKRK